MPIALQLLVTKLPSLCKAASAKILRSCVYLAVWTCYAACPGCMVGPNYQPLHPRLPSSWQNVSTSQSVEVVEVESFLQTVSFATDVATQPCGYCLSSNSCPWWQKFLDEDLVCLIGMQRARSPQLHELRASIDQAWHQRWVLKRGFFPQFENLANYQTAIPRSDSSGRVHENILLAEMGWELDIFGGRQRAVEASHRNLEAQVETYRNGMVFLTGEIGLFYTDFRVNEARIELQKQNIEFYEEVVRITTEKTELGGSAEIELDEAEARLQRELALLPDLMRARDAARVELARVVGVYSEELDPLLTLNQPIPTPGEKIDIPTPSEVLPMRPDIRRLERRVAGQVASVAQQIADELYPKFSFNYVWNGGDLLIPVINRSGIGLVARNAKRLISKDIELARVRENEALLERELHNYQLGLVVASAEVESAVVDLRIAHKKMLALEEALQRVQAAFDRVYDAYRESLVDIRRIIRIREDLIDTQTELIFARNLMAKGTVRLYKALGGIDVPPVPAKMIGSEYDVKQITPAHPFLSRLFSLNRDLDETLRSSRLEARIGHQPWYHVTPDGVLKPGVPRENPYLNRMWNLGD